jgi:hypothetical protein
MEIDAYMFSCPFCGSKRIIIPIYGLLEVYRSTRSVSVGIRKLAIEDSPLLVCQECLKGTVPSIETLQLVQELVWHILDLYVDGTGPPLKGDTKNPTITSIVLPRK